MSTLTNQKSKYSVDNINLLTTKQTGTINSIQMITLPKIKKYYTDDNVKVSSGLGKYLDNPSPDFWSAYFYLEDKQKKLSEELYYSLRDYTNYEYDFIDIKKEFLKDIKSISNQYTYQAHGLIEEIRKENKKVYNTIENLNQTLLKVRKQTVEEELKCQILDERFNILEDKLGVSIYKKRVYEKMTLNINASESAVTNNKK